MSLVQNLETLLESMNSGNWDNVDWVHMQSVMENMQGMNASSFGIDPLQWQELTQSFNQILNSQSIPRKFMPNADGSLSSNSSSTLSSNPSGGYQAHSFGNISQGSGPALSVGSFVSSASPGTSAGSYHSAANIPGIQVTPPPGYRVPRPNIVEEEEDEDEFDWSSIM